MNHRDVSASRVASAWLQRQAATRYVPLLIPAGPRGRTFPVPVEPDDVWIWEDPTPPTPASRPLPRRNVQHADKGHDWTWMGGKLRPAFTGRTGDVWLLLQYGPGGDNTIACPACGKDIPDHARFCPQCGSPTGAGRQATKSVSEKEDEEVRRLSKPSPRKKPPRDDSDRRRIEVDDSDSERDPDLSLNYKDTGG